ncbi:fimbrial protein [Izhakiella australiensis]|uniref:Fimbrial protein n=1 Tax=Izhakiella australiensis TaxID=1926881 RepID=A0A1S8YMQ4_9GAMM|nr:fimbrial protein [Izhakiella australiensis]OON40188.1 fimbrial protein [Izhakiella australiensis]
MFAQLTGKERIGKTVGWILLGVGMSTSTSALAEKCLSTSACRIPVSFTGIYRDDTCRISINNGGSDETVTLPTLSTSNLQSNGDEAGSQQFNITLKSCPASQRIDLHFVSAGSAIDSSTGNLVNSSESGMSRGVQIRIRDESARQMFIDDHSSFQSYVIPSGGNDVTHYYSASYYAKGSGVVTSGGVRALSGIELIYN